MEMNTNIDANASEQSNEIQAKPTVQRSAKGPVCIDECSFDGKYIQLANTSALKDADLSGWCLVRSIDNAPEISFTMPANCKLEKRKTVRIYAGNQDGGKSSCDLVSSDFDTWGVGHVIVTRLLNRDKDEKAVHIQRFLS
ncbi:unnamed protein product [Adineta ricciae]|uniref:LTD domain-containing protein n=1 Tax=Adineta ricciae TaxID=249248 RepID=A0A814FCD1_ADIRI|nr:unnamed protein product [Adineta ricciae]CAF1352287.1 unnamed protein product [Adineta ricciae]